MPNISAITEDDFDCIASDIATQLVSGDVIEGLFRQYKLQDVIEHYFANIISDEDNFDTAILEIMCGDNVEGVAKIRDIIWKASLSFSEQIMSDVFAAKKKQRDEDEAEYKYESRRDAYDWFIQRGNFQ